MCRLIFTQMCACFKKHENASWARACVWHVLRQNLISQDGANSMARRSTWNRRASKRGGGAGAVGQEPCNWRVLSLRFCVMARAAQRGGGAGAAGQVLRPGHPVLAQRRVPALPRGEARLPGVVRRSTLRCCELQGVHFARATEQSAIAVLACSCEMSVGKVGSF